VSKIDDENLPCEAVKVLTRTVKPHDDDDDVCNYTILIKAVY
jgi:hypothetical protein